MTSHKEKIMLALTIALSITLVCLLAACLSNAITVNSYYGYDFEGFACQTDGSNPFTVWAHVNLRDGMSKPEAVIVATKVSAHETSNAIFTIKSATTDDAGNWIVEFSWEVGQEPLVHYLNEKNPIYQTTLYN